MRIIAWGSISGARSILENLRVPNGRSDSPCHEHHHQHHQHQHEGQGGERQPNESQRNFSTSMAQVPVWTWVMQPFICECKGPPRTEERPKPALDCDSKTTGHLTLPMLSVSQLSRPAWPRTNAAGRDETRPASEVSGAVGKLSSPSCFPNSLVIPRPGAGHPRTLIDLLLQFLSYSRLPASNPKPSIKRWTWKLRFSISDLEGRLWLLTPLVSLARNGECSAGIFPLHG